MAFLCRYTVLSILLLVSVPNLISSNKDDSVLCESIVRNWAESALENTSGEDKFTLKDLLFFLHIPRTGGRTYFHCFLRNLYTSKQECPRSYDKLRFNPSKTNCHLMATHDDYSLMSKLPQKHSSVVTILRNPIDRIFSTYEFSVEVAARFLVHPNLTSATKMSIRLRPKSRDVSTLDIWPWKYLVPWMREDLFFRRDSRKLMEITEISESDPYNTEEIVMPLPTFINDPISYDIIHNGATFQVAGLTNNSCLAEAHKIRHCVRQHPILGHYILDVAKKRLDHMLYVGLTEDHRKSAALFANMVGSQVLSQSKSSKFTMAEHTNKSEMGSKSNRPEYSESSINSSPTSRDRRTKDIKTMNINMTAEKLMEAYEGCISTLRKSQVRRRTMSLKRIAPIKFSKEARKLVPETVLQQILTLNNLDVELYKHAQDIFKQQYKLFKKSVVDDQINNGFSILNLETMDGILHGYSNWKVFLVSLSVVLLIILLYLVLTAKRRTSKLKV